MVENRPWLTFISHLVLILAALIVVFPVYIALVAGTHDAGTMLRSPIPIWFGGELLNNLNTVLFEGISGSNTASIGQTILNSLIMSLGICFGKITISIIAAYAVVYFKFPFRMTAFWLIFLTLMLPVEVRILPTYQVVADLNMLDSYAGMIIPLIASATATFLFRQFFLSVPEELTEAARIDGAGPVRFFIDILLPLSRTPIAALFVIQFTYGWKQYLWPLLITTKESYYTAVVNVSRLMNTQDTAPKWNLIMLAAIIAMIPPILVVIAMQRQFVRGLVETEK